MSTVNQINTVASLRELTGAWRSAHEVIALVPTMGNLHEGHLSLARLARQTADRVVMTIFVNPAQFGEGEDFNAYPRTPESDLELVEKSGDVDVLFEPGKDEIYPYGLEGAVRIAMPPLSRELCGAHRPGHFDGVATVVARLLNIVDPDMLILGQKDYQQLILVQRMIADLRFPVQVIGAPIRRESDGLAMSSRNRYLTRDERRLAPQLHQAVAESGEAIRQGSRNFEELESRARQRLQEQGFEVDYVEVREAATLGRPNGQSHGDLIVLAAAWLGRARLIDNVRV